MSSVCHDETARVAAVQHASAYLDREGSVAKVLSAIETAAGEKADLVVFPETYVAGYPFWADFTAASWFDHPDQKAAFAQYDASRIPRRLKAAR